MLQKHFSNDQFIEILKRALESIAQSKKGNQK